MQDFSITPAQARRYMLLTQGLLGKHRFIGKAGVSEYFAQARCVQFDPVDVCGKSPEIALNSRVKGFRKSMLYELLYDERTLIDYFDKNLCIMPLVDFPYFAPRREEYKYHTRGKAEVDTVTDEIKRILNERGSACSQDIGIEGETDWYWSRTQLSRAALETLYFRGEIIVHHKKGAVKYYALPEGNIDTAIFFAPFPFENDEDYRDFRVLRRIKAVSLMWRRASDAWLDMRNFHAADRDAAFESLLRKRKIIEVEILGQKEPFYIPAEFSGFMEKAVSDERFTQRTELVAPLDSFMWDRKLIKALFGFDYTWEIYAKPEKRKYGFYVLPLIEGEGFIGRMELACDRKASTLAIKHLWLEDGVKLTKKRAAGIHSCVERFARFNECDTVRDEGGIFE